MHPCNIKKSSSSIIFLLFLLALLTVLYFIHSIRAEPSEQAKNQIKDLLTERIPLQRQRKCSLSDLVTGHWINDSSRRFDYSSHGYVNCTLGAKKTSCKNPQNMNAFKPDDPSCHLSPFSASRFLKCMRNRKITFIGDSLARNQYDSLLCLLSSHDHADRPDTLTATISHFQRYNFTVEAQFSYWRDYLMPRDIPSLSKEFHDIVIVSTGAHWYRAESETCPASAPKDCWKTAMLANDNVLMKRLEDEVVARLREFDRLPSDVTVLWRTPDVSHWSVPMGDNKFDRDCAEDSMASIYNDGLQLSLRDAILKNAPASRVVPFDVLRIGQPRADAHASPPSGKHDCLHWCFPGVPDVWNTILFNYLC